MRNIQEIKEAMQGKNQDDWITFDELNWLIEQAEKVESLKGDIGYWQNAHREDCAELQLKILELKNK